MDQQTQQNQINNEPYSWEQGGFNLFMERSPRSYCANPLIDSQISPFIESVVDNAIIYDPMTDTQSQNLNQASQQVSADQISGGVLQSDNGNLNIDLNSGTLQYTDGIQTLLNVGGANLQGTQNSLTINDANGQQLLGS